MSDKTFNALVAAAVVLAMLASVFMLSGAVQPAEKPERLAPAVPCDYAETLFDRTRVHTLDIKMKDWDNFLSFARYKQYRLCDVTIDGETVENVGIRAKGNGSMFSILMTEGSRYSFKIEFDAYIEGQTFHGLDKLSLNNIIQDTTYMKDYIAYTLMEEAGVPGPAFSYMDITVNGRPWGLYLGCEAIEESFLERNYGPDHGGYLYKPDDTQLKAFGIGGNFDIFGILFALLGSVDLSDLEAMHQGTPEGDWTGMDMTGVIAMIGGAEPDVALQYLGDDLESYKHIWNKAKAPITSGDKRRLVSALKELSGGDPRAAVNAEEVIRYFAVHNFLVNLDGYTGASIHNYYLFERDGVLEMLPWDYNLAYGTFLMEGTEAVNDPIDEPLKVTMDGTRPMFEWIPRDSEALKAYHARLALTAGTDWDSLIDPVYELIAPYVRKDATALCTYEEFEAGVQMLRSFLKLRSESVLGQLAGEIPTTHAGQAAAPESLIDGSQIVTGVMGDVTQGLMESFNMG